MENKQPQFFLGKESKLETENQPREMLKDLVLRWFLDKQAPLMLQDGGLPEWFHGFITRKQTEELLEDQEFGCFLIRLNERAFGYILSYRGKDRCRHFVINCQRNGHYVIGGDTQSHESLAELIGYYQTSNIEPFGENLTVAYTKPVDKSIYDEISLDQQTSSKQNSASATPLLARQASSSSVIIKSSKDSASNPSTNPRRKLQEQQKSFSKEKPNLSTEDVDIAPPVPDRSSLLMAESFEEDVGEERSLVYAELKKHPLDNRGPAVPRDTEKVFVDSPQKPEMPGPVSSSSSKKKTSSVFALSKDSERLYSKKISLIEIGQPGTIYSEIGPDHDKSGLMHLETQRSPVSLTPPKKATLSSPSATPPKLSPKLPSKPKTLTEPQGSQLLFPVYTTSLVDDEEHRKPGHLKTLPDSPKETMYGQIHKMKFPKPMAASDSTSISSKQTPSGWSKGTPYEHDSDSPTKSYSQISTKPGRSCKTQPDAENPYEMIPERLPKGSSARQVPMVENTYEQISFGLLKGAETKSNQKNDKPRRFLFADKKTKS